MESNFFDFFCNPIKNSFLIKFFEYSQKITIDSKED